MAGNGKRPTIKDVARLAGVSVSTASVALSGKGPVKDETRRRVMQAAQQLQYKPNALARSLVTRRNPTVGFLLPDIRDPYFHEVLKGVESVASADGYSIIVADSDRSPAKQWRAIELLEAHRVAGIIVAGAGVEDDQYLTRLEEDALPVVLLGRHGARLPTVRLDNEAAGRLATQHLLAAGRRRVALLGGPPSLTTSADRAAGYRAALAEAGLLPDPDYTVAGDFTPEGGALAVPQLVERLRQAKKPLPDGLVAANDQMAVGALKALKELGWRVPEDVAVVGIGDIWTASYVEPPLTTVALPLFRLGQEAMRLLVALHRGEVEARPPREIVLPVHLVVRASTPAVAARR